MSDPRAPVPGRLTVRQGREAYLAENGFTLEAYDAKWTEATFLGIPLAVPNTRHHRWGIMLHDLHHVATGYGTDLAGEGEVSAWELRRGIRRLGPYLAGLVATGTLVGLLFAPRRTIAAWRASGRGKSLFATDKSYDELLAMTVAELREELGIPAHGLATVRDRHARAPKNARGDERSVSSNLVGP